MSRTIIAFLFALVTGCCPAFAGQVSFSIGPQVYHHKYTEPGLMENKGYFAGAAYDLTWEDTFFISLNGGLFWGQADYTSVSTGSLDGKENLCADTRLLIGVPLFSGKRATLKPFAGIAYRYLSDDGENQYTSTGNWAYLRQSNYIYSPFGLRAFVPLDNGWIFQPSAEYDFFWKGTQKSHLGYQPGYENIENDQDGGYGLRCAMGFERQMPKVTLCLEFFYRYWHIDRSDITRDRWGQRWVEPENETREIGATVLFRF